MFFKNIIPKLPNTPENHLYFLRGKAFHSPPALLRFEFIKGHISNILSVKVLYVEINPATTSAVAKKNKVIQRAVQQDF